MRNWAVASILASAVLAVCAATTITLAVTSTGAAATSRVNTVAARGASSQAAAQRPTAGQAAAGTVTQRALTVSTSTKTPGGTGGGGGFGGIFVCAHGFVYAAGYASNGGDCVIAPNKKPVIVDAGVDAGYQGGTRACADVFLFEFAKNRSTSFLKGACT